MASDKKLIPKTFKITPYQNYMLNTPPYSAGNSGILIRILLEDYFAGNCPLSKIKFENDINNSNELQRKNNGRFGE